MFEHRKFGETLKLSVRGSSHAPRIEFKLEGFPEGFRLDIAALMRFQQRRAPGQNALSTPRRETDEVVFREGVENSVTTAGPITGWIFNRDQRPGDYGRGRTVPRPGHADFGQWIEYGRIPTGGGGNSGRMTAALTAAGGIALQYLSSRGIAVGAEVVSVGGRSADFERTIAAARDEADSVGGIIGCTVTGLPAGLGGALFAGIESSLSAAVFAIPGVKGIEFGNGFAASSLRGSENNDAFSAEDGRVVTVTNNHGGILGGRASGMPLVFRVAMKPTPTVFAEQRSVDLSTMEVTSYRGGGRHDPCIVLRAVAVVEAVTALVLADMILTAEKATARICLTLTGRTVGECLAQFRKERYFADMVELRADMLSEEERVHAAGFPSMVPVPAILTFRRERDGGKFSGPESERVAFFAEALKGSYAYVDFEDDFRISELEELARDSGTKVIRSLHLFDRTIGDIDAECRRLRGLAGDIPKIAFTPGCADDVAALVSADVPPGEKRIVMAMGQGGFASRVLAARTGSMLVYTSTGALGRLGHVSPHELVRDYRFRVLRPGFDLYGVTGYPLEATLSPAIHNEAFAASDIDAVMVPVPCRSAGEALSFMKKTGMKGMAVTIPHKRAIMPLLDGIDASAERIGAVNTVALENGRYIGYNTDAAGFKKAFSAFAGNTAGKRAAVLGAGGAALSVAAALDEIGTKYEIFHRRVPESGFDFIINATPVDPIESYRFDGSEAVYDLKYIPEETPLIARARAAGCKTENGYSMLTAQAALQRRIWLGGELCTGDFP